MKKSSVIESFIVTGVTENLTASEESSEYLRERGVSLFLNPSEVNDTNFQAN